MRDFIDAIDIDQVIENSFKDFHCRGFDYLCVHRTPELTLKFYFFDGDVSKLPEVVNPHDHRYNFRTLVVAGKSRNYIYDVHDSENPFTQRYNAFKWRTPLLGGSGFEFDQEVHLARLGWNTHSVGQQYYMYAEEFHTIQLLENQTVLMLEQYEDVVPLDHPTTTFVQGDAPSLDGLYNRMTADDVVRRIRDLKERAGIDVTTYKRVA